MRLLGSLSSGREVVLALYEPLLSINGIMSVPTYSEHSLAAELPRFHLSSEKTRRHGRRSLQPQPKRLQLGPCCGHIRPTDAPGPPPQPLERVKGPRSFSMLEGSICCRIGRCGRIARLAVLYLVNRTEGTLLQLIDKIHKLSPLEVIELLSPLNSNSSFQDKQTTNLLCQQPTSNTLDPHNLNHGASR